LPRFPAVESPAIEAPITTPQLNNAAYKCHFYSQLLYGLNFKSLLQQFEGGQHLSQAQQMQ